MMATGLIVIFWVVTLRSKDTNVLQEDIAPMFRVKASGAKMSCYTQVTSRQSLIPIEMGEKMESWQEKDIYLKNDVNKQLGEVEIT